MSTDNSRAQIIEQAAAYQTRIAAGKMNPGDWEELETWINASAEHRRVLESMGDLAQSLEPLGRAARARSVPNSLTRLLPLLQDARNEADAFADRRRGWRPWPVALAAGLVLAAALSMFFALNDVQGPPAGFVVHETAIAERRTVLLEDGSSIALNADTRLLVAFSESERRVKLEHGEIFADVASDSTRVFSVAVAGHVVRVTGTAFNVRFRDESARVTVDEGNVDVVEATAVAAPVAMRAGQALVLGQDASPVTLSQDQLRDISAWRDGWLHFDNESLAAVVDELNLHVDTRIYIGSRRAAQLRVSGAFNVDNLDGLLEALEAVLPITVTRKTDRIVIDYEGQ